MSAEGDIAAWNAIAPVYAAQVGDQAGSFFRRFEPFLLKRLGDLGGLRVLDLGCGHGWLSGYLTAAGASTYGLDGSSELVALARANHQELRFDVHDLTEPLSLSETFDAAVAHMVLMDLPALDAVMHSVAGALAPGGQFLFTILHPAFFNQRPSRPRDAQPWSRTVTGYLRRDRWCIESFGGHWHYHRPLQDYVQALASAGLVVAALDEPPSLPEHGLAESEWSEHERWFATIPTMLSIAALRPPP